MNDVWFDIPGYVGRYQASKSGEIRSIIGKPRSRGPIILSQTSERYRAVSLMKDGKGKKISVHRLIAMTFYGACPKGKEVAHLDGNRWNNKAENLAYVSRKENLSHKVIHGTDQTGSRHPRAKLTEKSVVDIRSRFKRWSERGSNSKELAKEYGVSRSLICKLVLGDGWAHVKAQGDE